MDNTTKINNSSILTDYIDTHSNQITGLPSDNFMQILQQAEAENIPIDQWHKILTFIFNQVGFWKAEWLFSAEAFPHSEAKLEMENWYQLCEISLNEAIRSVPNLKEPLENKRDLISLKHSVRKRIAFNKTRSLERITTSLLSKTAICLNAFGFQKLAVRFYIASMFPKGTIGRMAINLPASIELASD